MRRFFAFVASTLFISGGAAMADNSQELIPGLTPMQQLEVKHLPPPVEPGDVPVTVQSPAYVKKHHSFSLFGLHLGQHHKAKAAESAFLDTQNAATEEIIQQQ